MKKNMDYFKQLNDYKKEVQREIQMYISDCHDTFLEDMNLTFGDQLNKYTISLYELDEIISCNKNNFDENLINGINSLIEHIKECKKLARDLLKDMECTFQQSSLDTYNKKVKNKVEKDIISKINHKYTKNLVRNCIKEEIINSYKILSLYYDEQKENIKKYYNLFEFQDEIITNYEKFLNKKERLENMDIKRFTCTYSQMASFLENKGYQKIRQNSTSHAIYKNKSGHSLPLPNKRGEMYPTTISLILNQCNSNRNELGKFIKQIV